MRDPPRPLLGATDAIRLDAHAAATLRYIRESMDAASLVAVPGSAGIAMGVVGFGAACLAMSPALQDHWLSIWLVSAIVAAGIGGTFMGRQAVSQGLTLFGAPVRKFALSLCPCLLAGALMTAVHFRVGNLTAIPGTWLCLYGCSLLSASALTTGILGRLGSCFVVLGLIALVSPSAAHNALLGAGFGGLHLCFGITIWRRAHGA